MPMSLFSRRMIMGMILLTVLFHIGNLSSPHDITYAQSSSDYRVESDNPQVIRSGKWTVQTSDQASGESYLYSSGSKTDALTLPFTGIGIQVIYSAGPRLGTLKIEIDGTITQTKASSANQTAFQQSVVVTDLSDGEHTLKVYSDDDKIIAIDAFVITQSTDILNTALEDGDGGTQSSNCSPAHVTHLISQSNTGYIGNTGSRNPSISGDGRYVAFVSDSTTLVPGDTNGRADVFVYDRQTCNIRLVSARGNGTQANGDSYAPSISRDGRVIAYASTASNLVDGDTNTVTDIFAYEIQTSLTIRVSVNSGGNQANGASATYTTISSDGRYVAFASIATNLSSNDTNGLLDIFVRDIRDGITRKVSTAHDGAESIAESHEPSISGDGRYVAFSSAAANLVPNDTNGSVDVFVRDVIGATTTRISVATGNVQTTGGNSDVPYFSANGRYVVYESAATNLVTGDTNSQPDIFMYDRQTATTSRVSVGTGGTQASFGSFRASISADGRYVAFQSWASNLDPGGNNGFPDVFVHDRNTGITSLISATSGGAAANGTSYRPRISADGRYVTFYSDASNLVAGDANSTSDVFATSVPQQTTDTLVLFNPMYKTLGLFDTLADNPPADRYTVFSAYVPTTNGQWVMGDWNGDGLKTPGAYANGVFYFTNKGRESQASDWGGFWIGINGPVVAGRFTNASNDCIGAVDSVPQGGVTVFALYYNCDMSGTIAAPPLSFQWLSSPLPNPNFTGPHQFAAGDFNNDGFDSIAVRRGEYVAFTNVRPATGPAVFDLAQYVGTPSASDGGIFVVGDWDGNRIDSFGLFYQNGEFFYRNDLDWNSGVYINQSVGTPFVGPVQATSWR